MHEGHSHETTHESDLPPSLERALTEPGEYALRLRTGEIVRFTRAERYGAFVALFAPGGPSAMSQSGDPVPQFPHGLEVRITEIVWCARGPAQASAEEPTMGSTTGVQGSVQPSPGVRVPLRVKHADE
jgi:hypothetical protein